MNGSDCLRLASGITDFKPDLLWNAASYLYFDCLSRLGRQDQVMHNAELADIESHIHSLGDRLTDTARHLKGIAAVVEGMNKGATDQIQIAIHAVEAVAEDLSGIHTSLVLDEVPAQQEANAGEAAWVHAVG